MRKIILYIAQSLDGFIAKENGDVSWLEEVPNPEKTDYGYSDFLTSIDTVIMGRATFEQVCSFDMPYPYQSKKNFVFTKNPELPANENAAFISENHAGFVRKLKLQQGNDIWLVGGAKTNTFFLQHNLIDQIRLFVMPVLLGRGIPLFYKNTFKRDLQIEYYQVHSSGVSELWYKLL
ncbi:MAG TPA: dihydrofolate reductase family protein [Bacteroidales bacterium]|nr:dihydrofolate reductase family protein [Bacteroidales bacterium]HRX97264.1 dihydrofolate reductase family protein [Bacteroidales bacterium]